MRFNAIKYGYASTRAKAMKQKLVSQTFLNEMLQMNSLEELIEVLEEKSSYRNPLINATQKKKGLDAVKLAVRNSVAESVRKVFSFAPKDDLPKLGVLLSEFEADAMKNIVAHKAFGTIPSEAELVFVDDAFERRARQAMQAQGVEECVGILVSGNEELKVFLKKPLSAYSSKGEIARLLNAVEEWYFNKLGALASKEKDPQFRSMLKAKIDFYNATTILRMKKKKAERRLIEKELVGGGSGRLVSELLNARNAGECVAILCKRFGLNNEIEERFRETESLVPVEIALEKMFAEKIASALRISVLGFGAIAGFVFLKQMEAGNIRKIAYAIEYGLAGEASAMVFAV